MKRLIPFLIILLLLVGCSTQTTEQPTTPSTVQADIDVVFEQNSAVEVATDSAVKQYSVTGQIEEIDLVSNGLVLSNSVGKIGLLSSDNSFFTSSEVDGLLLVSAQNDCLVLYDQDLSKIYIANDNLVVTEEFKLEEGITGLPVYGSATHEIYYCVADYIRAMDLETGLARHVIQHVQENQSQISCYFDGLLIGREFEGKSTYISSVDGHTVFAEQSLREFATGSNNYYGIYRDGFVDQYVWGNIDSDPIQLSLSADEIAYPQMHSQCVVTVKKTNNNAIFSRYDMTTGICVGMVEFVLSGEVRDVVSSGSTTWILTDRALYCWDLTKTSSADTQIYTGPLITSDNPDSDGIEASRERAKDIGSRMGVEIRIWDEAIAGDVPYEVAGEYQVDIINGMLDEVETQLPNMPAQIFTPTEEYCGIQICLVRSIQGLDFVQYWDKGGLCIAITPTADVREALLTGLGWGIDSRVIGNSRDLDYWNDLNPKGFTYDYSYFVNEQRTDLQFLEGENRAFTDQRAMSFPSEDRARIFYYSLQEGNEQLFSSAIMQEKLKTFCEGIREAYGWQKETESFAWEQYLNDSLAYK